MASRQVQRKAQHSASNVKLYGDFFASFNDPFRPYKPLTALLYTWYLALCLYMINGFDAKHSARHSTAQTM